HPSSRVTCEQRRCSHARFNLSSTRYGSSEPASPHAAHASHSIHANLRHVSHSPAPLHEHAGLSHMAMSPFDVSARFVFANSERMFAKYRCRVSSLALGLGRLSRAGLVGLPPAYRTSFFGRHASSTSVRFGGYERPCFDRFAIPVLAS